MIMRIDKEISQILTDIRPIYKKGFITFLSCSNSRYPHTGMTRARKFYMQY